MKCGGWTGLLGPERRWMGRFHLSASASSIYRNKVHGAVGAGIVKVLEKEK